MRSPSTATTVASVRVRYESRRKSSSVANGCHSASSHQAASARTNVRGIPLLIPWGKHMRHRKRLQVLALLAGVALLVAACSDDNKSTTAAASSGASSGGAKPGPKGALEGLRGTTPLVDLPADFKTKLSSQGLDLQSTYNYGAESYDATVVIALATEAAATDGVDMAKQINQVTRNGTKCTSYQQCDQL